MTPREFLSQIVEPNLQDLAANCGDLRRAINAIAAVDALAAHIYYWALRHNPAGISSLRDDIGYRQSLASLNSDFMLVRDVAKALKHVQLTQGRPSVSNANQITSTNLGWGQARWGEGRWGSPPQAAVQTNAGDWRVVESLLATAIDLLKTEMTRLGVP